MIKVVSMSPTDIEYREKITPPYQSSRRVEVYGSDKEIRLRELPKDMAAFEKALTSVVRDKKSGIIREMKLPF